MSTPNVIPCSPENLAGYSFNPTTYEGSTFNEVKRAVWSDPYDVLPHYVRTVGDFYDKAKNVLFEETQRALNDPHDIRTDPIKKLVHPNGICLTGTWEITEENPYTGFYTPGTKCLIVVRSSVLLYETTQGHYRGFAFAGKLFPTLDPDERVKTTDFFCIDVLLGTKNPYYTAVDLTNEPPIGANPSGFTLFAIATATFGTFINANYNPVFRPVSQLANHWVPGGEAPNSPHWMKIRGSDISGNVDREDFRNELEIDNYPNGELIFDVSVSPKKKKLKKAEWQPVGQIVLTDSRASYSCDHKLVFQHPKVDKWK